MKEVQEAGVFTMSSEEYHADPCPFPSLSSGTVKTLVSLTPAHARAAHPKLNPAAVAEESDKFDIGTAVHSIVLEGLDCLVTLPFDDWRKKEAREARDAIRATGKIPVLAKVADQIRAVSCRVKEQVERLDVPTFRPGEGVAERSIIWVEPNGVWCRARPDWMARSEYRIDDLKTTAQSANPAAWARTAAGMGAHLQAAFYRRGYKTLFGAAPDFRFIVAEIEEPYLVSAVEFSAASLALADRQVEFAIKTWGECLRTNRWPGYGEKSRVVDIPGWLETEWLERETREEV